MTFAKLSHGGRVCGAGSRGQDKMLQQIYSLLGMCVCVGGGWGVAKAQGKSQDPHTSQKRFLGGQSDT